MEKRDPGIETRRSQLSNNPEKFSISGLFLKRVAGIIVRLSQSWNTQSIERILLLKMNKSAGMLAKPWQPLNVLERYSRSLKSAKSLAGISLRLLQFANVEFR